MEEIRPRLTLRRPGPFAFPSRAVNFCHVMIFAPRRVLSLLVLGCSWMTGCVTHAAPATLPSPPFKADRIQQADNLIEAAIARGELPGAVLLVGRGDRTGGQILYHKAYGKRAVKPEPQAMSIDTIFDLASLSKSIGCATSVMLLIERGKLSPDDKVAKYLPEFGRNGKENITIAHLLLHQAALIPDNAISDYADGPAVAWQKICALPSNAAPGTTFKYSDVGYIVLGKLVERVGGRTLDRFAADEIFLPAGMKETGYNPSAAWKARCAPTEQRAGHWMIGEVHDPRAFALGGVAGHAGLFSTSADLARFARMLLDGGTIDGKQVLKPETVARMTEPHGLPDGSNRRTFGFDCDTAYSGPRGERFERGTTFGHTGFTGTSIWIDPKNDCFYILLTNSVHPDGKGKVLTLRRQVGTVVGEALLGPSPTTQAASTTHAATQPTKGPLSLGLDVLVEQQFAPLKGKRVALVTNQTGLDQTGRRTVDLLSASKEFQLVKLFSPEHGLFGLVDEKVSDTTDPKTGLKVYSLYGKANKPTPEMMAGVDVLVFDIQDVGARYYTYLSTLGLCMEACAESKVKMMVLDRPNPVTGLIVDGPIADAASLDFTGYARIPVSHGMTLGELASMFNVERKINCDLKVIPMQGWKRTQWFDETNLIWTHPSPNLRNPTQALLYLGVGQIETANISVGRGTDQPFEMIGAPWIDARKLAAAMNASNQPGLRFTPIRFTPKTSKFADKECQGIYIAVTDRSAVAPVKLGAALAWQLHHLFGDAFELEKIKHLVKNASTLDKIKSAASPAEVPAAWEPELSAFKLLRAKYLIYP